jgi:hypothetical protein
MGLASTLPDGFTAVTSAKPADMEGRMRGLTAILGIALPLTGCATGYGGASTLLPMTSNLEPTAENRALTETAAEVRINAFAGQEICRSVFATGSRIRRVSCEVLSPAEAVLQDVHTDDELGYARWLEYWAEDARLAESLGDASRVR